MSKWRFCKCFTPAVHGGLRNWETCAAAFTKFSYSARAIHAYNQPRRRIKQLITVSCGKDDGSAYRDGLLHCSCSGWNKSCDDYRWRNIQSKRCDSKVVATDFGDVVRAISEWVQQRWQIHGSINTPSCKQSINSGNYDHSVIILNSQYWLAAMSPFEWLTCMERQLGACS